MEEKPNYYSVLPATIRYDHDLQPNAKLLYSEITSLCNYDGYCFANNGYFAKLYDVDKTTISRWISSLVKKKYIFIKKIKKNETDSIDKRIICLDDVPIDEIINTYMQKDQYPLDENVNHNNIKDNNNSNNIEDENQIEVIDEFVMDDETFTQTYQIIEKEFGRTISPLECELIRTWDYPIDILKLAISEASTSGQFVMKYIDRIIYNWKKGNVRTIQDAKRYIENFHKRKNNKYNQPKEKIEIIGTDCNDGYEIL